MMGLKRRDVVINLTVAALIEEVQMAIIIIMPLEEQYID